MHATLANYAAQLAADGCPTLAAGITEALTRGGRILRYRGIHPRGFEFLYFPIPADMTPADVWADRYANDPDAYDRPCWYNIDPGTKAITGAFAI